MTSHPAKFTDTLLTEAHKLLVSANILPPMTVFDPMAGTGKGVKYFRERGYDAFGVELEPEWARMCDMVQEGDATDIYWMLDDSVDAIVTSPAYGNRMADSYAGDAKGSKRHTYRTALGRDLTVGSGAALQWGDAYRELHSDILNEMFRVCRGRVIVNMKNHIRKGELQDVVGWWVKEMSEYSVDQPKVEVVPTPGQRHGANRNLRVDHEVLIVATPYPTL